MMELLQFDAPDLRWIILATGAVTIFYVLYGFFFSGARIPYFGVARASAVKAKKPLLADYSNVFPPSRRTILTEMSPEAKAQQLTPMLGATSRLLGLTSDYTSASPSDYIFSGFTVGEVKALGDFPDYAKLSGVPLPSPAEGFHIDTNGPRPYRPFRWNYHQTMAYSKMDSDYWLELENTYRERILQRQTLFAKHGDHVLQALPGTELACKELMEMAVQFLCARYPEEFQLVGNTLHNNILKTKANVTSDHPLHVLLNHVPEDFALLLRDESTGRYVFRAGVICSSLGWSLGTKIGKDMSAVHSPVPDFEEKLAFSLDRFFTKMETSSPIQRGSWGLEIGQPLYLPADHPDFAHRNSQDSRLTEQDIYLRVDWQTLRRLPLSGAIVFNYKALFTPLTHFRDEPYIPSLVLKVLNEGKKEIMEYKGTWHVEHVVKPALKEYETYQLQQGMIKEQWEPSTLDEAPFFPGWEKK